MGKTNPTYRQLLDEWIDEFDHFKRGLRHHWKPAFEDVMDGAKQHADAGSYANPIAPDIPDYAFLSIYVEQQREIRDLRDRLDDLDGSA